MKIINGQKRYLVNWVNLDNNKKAKVYFSSLEFEFAEHLCRSGFIGIIEGLGYVYHFDKLKQGMEKFGGNPYWKNVLGIAQS